MALDLHREKTLLHHGSRTWKVCRRTRVSVVAFRVWKIRSIHLTHYYLLGAAVAMLVPPHTRRHSDVDHHVALRSGAADEDISLRRWIERIGLVADGPGDQSALAVVTDAGAARPPDAYVTRFRQLEKTLVVLTPPNGDTAPREGDQWPCAGGPRRLMRCALRRGGRTGSQRSATGKDLGMDAARWHAPGGQARAQVAEEARWPANVEVAVSRDAKPVEDLQSHATGRVVIAPLSIIRGRPAVPDLTSPASKHPEKLSRLCSERMGLSIACTVQPPDRAMRSASSQGMEHREHGCRADSRT